MECQGKQSWPELIGKRGCEAETTIERQNNRVNAIVVPDGSSVIENFSCNRVWVWVDEKGYVVRTPVVG